MRSPRDCTWVSLSGDLPCGSTGAPQLVADARFAQASRMIEQRMLFTPPRDEPLPVGDRPRILLVRLTAVGDVIHGLPVAYALRDRFPQAHLAWAVEGAAGQLLVDHPALDEVIQMPRRWYQRPQSILAMRRELLARKFTVTVDLQCLTKSSLVAWLTGAQYRLGVAGRDGRELSRWLNNVLTPVHARHVVDHYLGILQPLGIAMPPARFELAEPAAASAKADDMLADLHWGRGEFAVLNAGAGWPSKLWPAGRYGELAQWLLRERGLPSLAMWGTPQERPLAEQMVAASGGAARLAPATSLMELASLLRRAALFVGSDTGPMHLSVAVGTPTISLHGTSRAEWCGAYGSGNRTLQRYYAAGTSRTRRQADNAAMRAISVESVCEACDELFTSRCPELSRRAS